MTGIEIIATVLFFSLLPFPAFLFFIWWRINHPIEDERDTFAGAVRELGEKAAELKQAIGQAFIPALENILDKFKELK